MPSMMSDTNFAKHSIVQVGVKSVPTSVESDGGHSDTMSDSVQPSLLSTLIHAKTSRPRSLPLSPTMSNPNGQIEPAPILRRDSTSVSDVERGPGLAMTSSSTVPSRRSALKFAVASHPAHEQSPFNQSRPTFSDSEESDLGYQEDEEDGAFSDDDDYPSHIPPPPPFPFARPTNYHPHVHSPSPPPAPAILPPPPRRGRGHVRVKDATPAPKSCSRHCSPPPSGSKSNSRRSSHVSDAGPRDGRAGSPMPDVSNLESEDEVFEDDESVDENAFTQSTEAVVKDETLPASAMQEFSSSVGEGVRDFLRRASEHLPGFRRPSFTPSHNDSALDTSEHEPETTGTSNDLKRSRSLSARVPFNPNPPHRIASGHSMPVTGSADKMRPPRPIACAPRRKHEDIAWSDEAVL